MFGVLLRDSYCLWELHWDGRFPLNWKSELFFDPNVTLHTQTHTLGSAASTWAKGRDWTADLCLTHLYRVDSISLALGPRGRGRVSSCVSLVLTLSERREREREKKEQNKMSFFLTEDRSPHILYPATANTAPLNRNHRNSPSPTKSLLCLNQTLTLTAGDRETILLVRPNHTHTSKVKNFTSEKNSTHSTGVQLDATNEFPSSYNLKRNIKRTSSYFSHRVSFSQKKAKDVKWNENIVFVCAHFSPRSYLSA